MDPQPTLPAVQMPTASNSNSMVQSLAAALNPQSAAALATVETAVTAPETTTPAAPPPVEPAPELTKPDPVRATTPKEAPKKGFDGLLEAEEVKPADAPTEPDDLPPDATTPQAKNAWSTIKTELKTLKQAKEQWEKERTELAEKAAQAKQFNEADPKWKEFQAAQKRLEELEPVVARVAYQKTAAYKEAVETPRNHVAEAAQALAKQFDIPEAKMVTALTEGDPKRQTELLIELSEGMDDRSKVRLYRLADDLDAIQQLDDRMSANAIAAHKEAEAREQEAAQRTATERKAAEMRAIEDSRTRLQKVAHLFKMEGEDDATAVNKIIEGANAIPFDEQTTDAKAFAMLMAEAAPRMQRLLSEERKASAALRKEIAELHGATPRAAAGQQVQQTEGPPRDMMTAIQADLAKLGLVR